MGDSDSFDTLKIEDNILRGVYSYGFEKPSAIQVKSIPKIIEGKDIIAQAQSGTGHSPEEVIVRILRPCIVRFTRGLRIGPAEHDQTMQFLDRSSPIMKGLGKIIQQCRVRGCFTSYTEVIRASHQPPAKVMPPHPVHQNTARQGIGRFDDGLCQTQAPTPGRKDFRAFMNKGIEKPGVHLFSLVHRASSQENVIGFLCTRCILKEDHGPWR